MAATGSRHPGSPPHAGTSADKSHTGVPPYSVMLKWQGCLRKLVLPRNMLHSLPKTQGLLEIHIAARCSAGRRCGGVAVPELALSNECWTTIVLPQLML